jgi:hypothetical protein
MQPKNSQLRVLAERLESVAPDDPFITIEVALQHHSVGGSYLDTAHLSAADDARCCIGSSTGGIGVAQ